MILDSSDTKQSTNQFGLIRLSIYQSEYSTNLVLLKLLMSEK